ncbi:MAG: addiction module protein [Limisphaerales bacterium]
MPIELEIEKMTLEEKLRAMETLWADLSRNDQNIQSPPWHEQILKERDQRVESGREQFQDWEDAKRELRDRLK